MFFIFIELVAGAGGRGGQVPAGYAAVRARGRHEPAVAVRWRCVVSGVQGGQQRPVVLAGRVGRCDAAARAAQCAAVSLCRAAATPSCAFLSSRAEPAPRLLRLAPPPCRRGRRGAAPRAEGGALRTVPARRAGRLGRGPGAQRGAAGGERGGGLQEARAHGPAGGFNALGGKEAGLVGGQVWVAGWRRVAARSTTPRTCRRALFAPPVCSGLRWPCGGCWGSAAACPAGDPALAAHPHALRPAPRAVPHPARRSPRRRTPRRLWRRPPRAAAASPRWTSSYGVCGWEAGRLGGASARWLGVVGVAAGPRSAATVRSCSRLPKPPATARR